MSMFGHILRQWVTAITVGTVDDILFLVGLVDVFQVDIHFVEVYLFENIEVGSRVKLLFATVGGCRRWRNLLRWWWQELIRGGLGRIRGRRRHSLICWPI